LKTPRSVLPGTLTLTVFIVSLCLAGRPIRALGQDPPQEKQSESKNQQASVSDQQIPPAIAKELDAMKRRIEQLETDLKQHQAAEQPSTATHSAKATVAIAPAAPAAPAVPPEAEALLPTSTPPAKKQPAEPFAFADFTWLNGNPRTKTPAFDSKFFTPEIRADVDYVYDFRHPTDDTISGSSEVFRQMKFSSRSWVSAATFTMTTCAPG
jgi:hypothetical protein